MGGFGLGWWDSGSTSEEKLLARRTELEAVPPDEFVIAKKTEHLRLSSPGIHVQAVPDAVQIAFSFRAQ